MAKIRQTYYWDQEIIYPKFIQILPGTLFAGNTPSQEQVDITRKALCLIEQRLEARTCLAVDYITLVDIMVAQFILQLTTIPGVVCMEKYPCMKKWFEKISAMQDWKDSVKEFLPMQEKLTMQIKGEGREWVEPKIAPVVAEPIRSKTPEKSSSERSTTVEKPKTPEPVPVAEKKIIKVASPIESVYWSRLSPPSTVAAIIAKMACPDIKLVELNMMKKEHKEDWYLGVNPNGTVPGYKKDDLNVFESGAICRYLATLNGRSDLVSENLEQKALVYKMMCHINERVWPTISKCIFPMIVNKVGEMVTPEKIEGVKKAFEKFEKILDGKEFIWGDKITIPDVHCASLFGYITKFEEAGMDIKADDYPNVCAWLKRVASNEEYKTASGAVINSFDPKIILPPGAPVNVQVVRSHC